MNLSTLAIDLLYLILYGLEPFLKLAMGALLALMAAESLIHAVQIIRG